MAEEKQTFIFAGDTEVGQRLNTLLIQGGFLPASDLNDADVVLTYHENQSKLEDIYFGSPGLLSDTKEGVILVDLSPTTPVFAQELNALALVNDRQALDAPLVVRDMVAQDAFALSSNLMIVAGGASDSYDAVYPMLRAIADRVYLWVNRVQVRLLKLLLLSITQQRSLVLLKQILSMGFQESYLMQKTFSKKHFQQATLLLFMQHFWTH